MDRILKFSISQGDDTNIYEVKIPTAGQLIDIEVEKTRLSSGLYGSMARVGTASSSGALDVIDVSAYLRVLVPALMKDLKVANITDLDIFDFKLLMKDYSEQFLPWVNDWQRVLNAAPEKKKIEEDEQDLDSTEETE